MKTIFFSLFLFIGCYITLFALPKQTIDTLLAEQYIKQAQENEKIAEHDKAILNYQKAVAIYDRAELWEKKIRINNIIGPKLVALQRMEEARTVIENSYKEALEKLESGHSEIGNCYHKMGGLSFYSLEYNNAIEYYKRTFEVWEPIYGIESRHISILYSRLGNLYSHIGQLDKGLEYRKKVLNYFIDCEDEESRSWIYNNIGVSYIAMGEIQKALECFQKALQILLDYHPTEYNGINMGYSNIGECYFISGDFDSALEYCKKGIQDILTLPRENHMVLASNYSFIGKIYAQKKNYDRALEYYKKGQDIRLQFYPENYLPTIDHYIKIAEVYRNKKQYDLALYNYRLALGKYKKTLPIYHPIIAETYNKLAHILVQQKDFNYALENIQVAIKINHSKNLTLLNSYHKKSQIFLEIYQTQQCEIDIDSAYVFIKKTNDLINDIRLSYSQKEDQVLFNKTIYKIYETGLQIVYSLFEQTGNSKYTETAFQFIEGSKATSLIQTMNAYQALSYSTIPDSLISKEKELRMLISSYQKEINYLDFKSDSTKINTTKKELLSNKETYNQLIEFFEQEYPDYYNLKHKQTKASISAIQNTLNSETAILEYYIGDSSIYTFSIEQNNIQFIKRKFPPNWEQTISDFRKASSNAIFVLHQDSTQAVYDLYTESAHQLYQLILEPCLNNISSDIKNLRIIPDGQLNQIPFELLLQSQKNIKQNSYKNLDYLLNDYVVSYVISSKFLLNSDEDKESKEKEKLVVYGGFAPEYPNDLIDKIDSLEIEENKAQMYEELVMRGDLNDLPSARENVRKIAQILNGKAFISKEANKDNFIEKFNSFQILHFAMHGLVNNENPLYSQLVFTPANDSTYEHLLNAADLYNMEINADLAVLSACNTGYGEVKRGEGVLSLARAFTYAGCPSLIMSLWSVPDVQTSKLMLDFFQNIKNGKRKDVSLRNAKLKYLKDSPENTSHPLYWAGFVPNGDMSALSIGNHHETKIYGFSAFAIFLLITLLIRTYLKVR